MHNAILRVPEPKNEARKLYNRGSEERRSLEQTLRRLYATELEIPLIIGGKPVTTGTMGTCVCPHEHGHILARYHMAGPREIGMAVEAARTAWKEWSEMNWAARAAVFLKASEILSGRYRDLLNASTMLNISKNVDQAEIDAACETVDFLRYNVHYMTEIYREQPYSSEDTWNLCEYRALEGFVFAITPFNFTSIGANLPTSPALMGNVVLWKPASTAVLPAYFTMKLLMDAGLPEGVINFIPGGGRKIGDLVLSHPELSGVHFTGSAATFNSIWRTIGTNIDGYRTYPRIAGETGGKDFVVVHSSADPYWTAVALTEGAFGYQGQKCSAASRVYVSDDLWPTLKNMLLENISSLKMGDVMDFDNCINAVIDKTSFDNINGYIDYARKSSEMEILLGGKSNDTVGYFINPTVIQTTNPKVKLMQEEIFGPVLTIYVYRAGDFEKTLQLCNETSPYGLTGSIFATDRMAIMKAYRILRHAAGNFYINDKPTGAVVGQQPFGGGRKSGTNDKAGSKINLFRWISTRTVKETFVPPTYYRCPIIQPPPQI